MVWVWSILDFIRHWPHHWSFWPFVAALVLISIHTYLGLHVITRKVLFVDLALAQIAALGSSVTFLYGFEPGSPVTYYVSLLFAVIGAWVFSVTRIRGERVPHEAIIGLAFAIASAGSILLSAENPHGAEHLQAILRGSIVVVTGPEVGRAAILYVLIAAFHWRFRRRFLRISTDPEGAAQDGVRVRLWDFLFYLSFACVITMSVHIAGVLLVFCLLIAPAVCGALFADAFSARLFIGWGASVLAVVGGLGLTAGTDWPPAPCIISAFAALLIGAGLAVHIRDSPRRLLTCARIAGGALALAAALWGMTAFLDSDFARSLSPPEESGREAASGRNGRAAASDHSHGAPEHPTGVSLGDLRSALWDEHENVRAKAAEDLGRLKDPSVVPDLIKALKDPSDAVKEKAAVALGALGNAGAAPALEAALAEKAQDEWVTLRAAEALCRCGGPKGLTALLGLASEADAKQVRGEALHLALALAGRPPVKDPASSARKAALESLAEWWKKAGDTARWDAAKGRFVEGP